MRWIGLLFLSLFSLNLFAQDNSIEARLQKLEQEVVALRQENAQLRKDLGLEVTARQADVKIAGKEQSLQLGGMMQVQGESGSQGDTRFSDDNDRLYLRRARVDVAGKFLEDFNFKTELELSGSLSNSSAFRAQLTDAYATWTRYGKANVRAGQFKTPFGFEQLYPDPILFFAERSMASDRLTPGRQLGVQTSGAAYSDRLTWALGLFNGNGTNQNLNDSDRFMEAARVAVVPLTGRYLGHPTKWSVGVNNFRTRDGSVTLASDFNVDSTPTSPARDNIFAGDRSGIGYDSQLQIGPVEAWGEYLRVTFEPNDHLPRVRLRSSGWSGQVGLFVIPNKLQLAARREVFDPNNDAAGDETHITTLGANWFIKQHDLKLQLDWLRSDVPGRSSSQQKWIARLQTQF